MTRGSRGFWNEESRRRWPGRVRETRTIGFGESVPSLFSDEGSSKTGRRSLRDRFSLAPEGRDLAENRETDAVRPRDPTNRGGFT